MPKLDDVVQILSPLEVCAWHLPCITLPEGHLGTITKVYDDGQYDVAFFNHEGETIATAILAGDEFTVVETA